MKKYILSPLILLAITAPLMSAAATVSGEARTFVQTATINPTAAKKAYILRKIAEVKADILAVDRLVSTLEKKRDAAKKAGANTTVYNRKITTLKASKEALQKALALLEKQLALLSK